MLRFYLVLFCCLLLNGCISHYKPYRFTPYVPQSEFSKGGPSDCKVKVYRSSLIGREYRTIGTCSAWANRRRGGRHIDDALKSLEKCACENGGNALIIVRGSHSLNRAVQYYYDPLTGQSWPTNVYAVEKGVRFRGEVIIFQPDQLAGQK
jgi:hypothetical protein